MRRINSLGMYIHPSRLNEAIDLLKAHTVECTAFEVIYGGADVNTLRTASGVNITLYSSNYRQWDEQLLTLMSQSALKGIIYLGEKNLPLTENKTLVDLLQKSITEDIPVAVNLSEAEALIHLVYDYPEALSGHHLAAVYLEEVAYQHDC